MAGIALPGFAGPLAVRKRRLQVSSFRPQAASCKQKTVFHARRGKSSYKLQAAVFTQGSAQQASGLSPGACGSCFLHVLHALHGEKGLLFSPF
jgi:hypothetical protein